MNPSQQPSGSLPEDSLALLRETYETGLVTLADLVLANALRSETIEPDATRRTEGDRLFPLLRAKFLDSYRGCQLTFQSDAGLALCLYPGNEGQLEIVVLRRTIHFDWRAAGDLQAELNELEDDATRWLRPKERRSLRLNIYGLLSHVHSTVSRENRCHAHDQVEVAPTAQFTRDLEAIRPQIETARGRLKEEAERAVQAKYVIGMGIGTGLLAVVCGFAQWMLAEQHVPAIYAIGAAVGGVGAFLSVLERLTRNRLRLDYRTDPGMIRFFGIVRPFVGAVFGMITFCIVKSGLLSAIIVIPKQQGQLLALVCVLCFLAAFNERFFQDMLRVAGQGIGASAGDSQDAPAS